MNNIIILVVFSTVVLIALIGFLAHYLGAENQKRIDIINKEKYSIEGYKTGYKRGIKDTIKNIKLKSHS